MGAVSSVCAGASCALAAWSACGAIGAAAPLFRESAIVAFGAPDMPWLAAMGTLVIASVWIAARCRSRAPESMSTWLAFSALLAISLADSYGFAEPARFLVGGLLACALAWAGRTLARRIDGMAASLHLIGAGVCVALAYLEGLHAGAMSLVAVCAAIALIGVHLSLAMAGRAGAQLANSLTGGAACALTVLSTGSEWSVTGVALVIACPASALSFARRAVHAMSDS